MVRAANKGTEGSNSMVFAANNVAVVMGDVNLFRAVVAARLVPFVISRDPSNVLRHSRFYRGGALVADPSRQPDQFIADLLEVGRKFTHPPVLLTTHDNVLLLISRHREALQELFQFRMPPQELVESLVDKARFALLARTLALPVPDTIRSCELDGSMAALKSIAPPYVLKPNSRHYGWHDSILIRQRGGGPQKVLRANDASECERLLPTMRQVTSDFVVQRYIPGDDRQIYSFHAYYNGDSEPLVRFVGRKIRSYPNDSGVSTYLELVKDARVESTAMDILRKLRFVGPVKLDFKEDPRDGRLYLLEVNARCTLWNHLGAVNGVSIPRAAWADLNGERVAPQDDYGVGVRWLSFGNDFRSFIRCYHRNGDLTWAQYLRSLIRPKVYDVFAWSDPIPALIQLIRFLKPPSRPAGLLRATPS